MVIFTSLNGKDVDYIESEYLAELCYKKKKVPYMHPEKGPGYIEIDWSYYT